MEYRAVGYARLSEENRRRTETESDSILGQRLLIRDYAARASGITLEKIYTDDGYSGGSFDRPGFLQMMQDLEKGIYNCVIVKDLSRFGRDYVGAGHYIQNVFPRHGIRFIAVTEQYDSMMQQAGDQLILPFRNIINQMYASDISLKVRSALDSAKNRGNYAAALAPFGYRKCPGNKHRLETDRPAADTVRLVYALRVDGFSLRSIAGKLNALGLPTPSGYRNHNRYKDPGAEALWDSAAVSALLRNTVYTGRLEMKKTTSFSHKLKQRIRIPPEQRAVFEVEPLIGRPVFSAVQDAPHGTGNHSAAAPPLLSGILFCSRCGTRMYPQQYHGKKGCSITYRCRCKVRRGEATAVREPEIVRLLTETLGRAFSGLPKSAGTLNGFAGSGVSRLAETQRNAAEAELLRYTGLISAVQRDYEASLLCEEERYEYTQIYMKSIQVLRERLETLAGLEKHFENCAERILAVRQDLNISGTLAVLDRRLVRLAVKRIELDRGQVRICMRFQQPASLIAPPAEFCPEGGIPNGADARDNAKPSGRGLPAAVTGG